jgi:hypothetical protein
LKQNLATSYVLNSTVHDSLLRLTVVASGITVSKEFREQPAVR